MEAATATCATDIADLQDADGQLSASSATGGRTTSWTSLGTDLDLTITRADTLIAWCNAQEGGGTGMLRVTMTSADGSWTASGTSSEPEESGSDSELIFAMATFSPPAAGDYVLSCEAKASSGWEHFDLLAMQAATTISESGEDF